MLALVALGVLAWSTHAQACPQGVRGAWRATLPARELFQLQVRVRELAQDRYEAAIRSARAEQVVPVWRDGTHLRFQPATLPIAFDGVLSEDAASLGGFIQHAQSITRVVLPMQHGTARRTWTTTWTPLGVSDDSLRFDLYIGDDGAGGIGGYFFFRDQRLPSLWGYGLACHGDTLSLGERNLAMRFVGRYETAGDRLVLTATAVAGSATMPFERMPDAAQPSIPDLPEDPARPSGQHGYVGGAPPELDDGWPTASPAHVGIDTAVIGDLVHAVVDERLPLTHSVLVIRHGRLAVEEYFYGFDRETWHDMRSASKTVTSTLVGLAIAEGRIASASAPALPFFPRYRRYAEWDPRKAQITIRDLLTMSSGLDANDSDPRSVASEGAYQSQTDQPDWVKFALDAPMIADPGSQPLYGGANPLILGGVLAAAVGEPVEWFADRTLFTPLGIERYRFLLDPTGIVYMGGGLHLRPRDMAKYGQLYLNGGVWRGTRILSQAWIEESWDTYGRLAPLDRNGHRYGYLWWHHSYDVGGQTVESVEARGNGGQYIFVVPSLDLVVVITAGNFRTGKTRQPETIMRDYILPAVMSTRDESDAR